jgi:hypothetical protein
MYEHRNYLPMYGFLMCFFYYLLDSNIYPKTLLIRQIVTVLLIGMFSFSTYSRATIWSNPFDLASYDVERHPQSARSNGKMGSIYANINTADTEAMKSYYQLAIRYFDQATLVDNNYTDGLFGAIILNSKRNEPINNKWLIELQRRLQYSPFANNNGDQLNLLIACASTEQCKIDQSSLLPLIESALKNPTLTGANLPIVYTAKANYLISFARDYDGAAKALLQAAETSTDLEYRVSLIRFLIVINRNEEAREQLAILKQKDRLESFRSEIETKLQFIEQQEKQSTSTP